MADRHQEQDRDIGDWAADEASSQHPTRFYLRQPRRRVRLRRAFVTAASFGASVLFLCLVAVAILFGLLLRGPLSIDVGPQIVAALNERVGHGYTFEVGSTTVEATSLGPALTLNRLAVNDPSHHPVITSQHAAISVDPLALLRGKISPRKLKIRDIDLRLLVLASGDVAISAGTGTSAVPLAAAFSPGVAIDRAPTVAERRPSLPAADLAPTSSVLLAGEQARGSAALRALGATLRSLVDATTAPDSAFSALDSVDVSGRLVLDDRTHGTESVFNNTELTFDKKPDGSATLDLAADGPTGRWTLAAHASRSDDNTKMLAIDVKNLSLDVVTLAGGLRNVGFDFDMPISANASVRIGPDGLMDQATGRFQLGSGYFKLDDPDHEPLLIDTMSGGFHLDAASHAIVIDSTQLKAGGSSFSATGRVDLPAGREQSWKIAVQASGTFGTERPGEKPIRIARSEMLFHVMPNERRFLIDRVSVDGPEVAFESFGDVRVDDEGVKLANTSTVKNMPAKALSRLWPSFIAAPVRAWFLANVRGGTVVSGKSVVNLTDRDLALMRAQRSVPDNHVRLDYQVADLALDIMPGVPPLTSITGSGVVTGDTSLFSVSHAEMEDSPGRKLTLVDGTFNTPDTDPKPTPALIDAHITGNIDAVADILARDALKPFANVPIDAASFKGQVDGHLNIALLLGDHVPPDSAKISVTATASNVVAERLIGKEGLTDTTLQRVADKTGIRAKSEGRMYGAPATIDLRKPAGNAPGEAVINLTLDEAARAKAGMSFGKSLTGIVSAHITTPLALGEKRQGAVELDFAKSGIDGVVPGFSKAVGKPGKATLSVTQKEGGGASLDNIVFEGGGLSLRGAAELDAAGGLTSARMSQVRLSPGDDMKLDARQSADGLKLVVRGASVDARPFLKWLSASDTASSKEPADKGKSLDVDFHANVLTGQNKQALGNADIRFSRKGSSLRSLTVTGRLARVLARTKPVIVVKSGDAGDTLAFMDLYKRMLGGRLDATVSPGENRMEGSATIHDFTLREDPNLKQLATEGMGNQSRSTDSAKIDPAAVSFNKLEASFSKVGDKVTVRDGTLAGPAVGATVAGTLDFGRDQVDLEGTFVPLYGVNNLFSQIPLFGPILGGGEHEGLFGISYKITGPAASPVLSVNPLSAMAPGFLRKIFGALDNAAQAAATQQLDRGGSPPLASPPPESAAEPEPVSP